MANNFDFTPGSGKTGAAEDIGGVLYPKVIATEIDGTDSGLAAKLGAADEPAASTDTATSGINGLLKRIAQRLSSLIALLPASLGANGGLKIEGIASGTPVPVSETDGANVTLGAKADAKSTATDSTAVTIMSVLKQISASVQAAAAALGGTLTVAAHAVTQSGTWTVQPGNTANTTAWKVDGSAVTQPISMATNTPVGNVAHDGADSGAPVKTGGRARSSEIAAVANDDRVDSVYDLTGKQIVLPYANPENFVSGAITSAMTGTTSTSLIAAPASGLRNYITQITVSNSHATVGTDIIIQDGSGGTTLYVIPAPPAFGGATLTFPVPLRQPSTATALYVANVTTGSSTKVSASGYKGV
jgi:hypothetical protein